MTCVNRVFARHKSTPRGCAHWHDIVVVENDPSVSQRVNIWCWNLIGTMKANIIPTLSKKMCIKN